MSLIFIPIHIHAHTLADEVITDFSAFVRFKLFRSAL